jgi:hypothetical protein
MNHWPDDGRRRQTITVIKLSLPLPLPSTSIKSDECQEKLEGDDHDDVRETASAAEIEELSWSNFQKRTR